MPQISLQPKQVKISDFLKGGLAKVMGVGGGRGAAKSGGADRVIIAELVENPGIVACIVMRNYDQIFKYHIEPIKRTFPEFEKYLAVSNKNLIIPVGGGKTSQLDFSYAESLPDVERRFRSANYKIIIVDQAEQFSEEELREIRKACRWPGGTAKMVLLFNMRGAGIQTLAKWFHRMEFNKDEDPNDYTFLHVFPWDNVEWVRPALGEDGLTPKDYYAWTCDERRDYAATRGEYTKQLATDDEVIRNSDWYGSWDSLEGAYFGRVYDRQATMIDDAVVQQILKPWDVRWMSEDWGKSHFCVTLWWGKCLLSPAEVLEHLGWVVTNPLTVVITYRRQIVNEMTSGQVGALIRESTPKPERERIARFFLSPDAFGERDSPNTIAMNIGKELRPYGMPSPEPADTDRAGGWTMMYNLLFNTKAKGMAGDTVWLISSEVPELLESIPMLMRDPKDLDVVLKTDKGQARKEQDVSETARYGLKSMLSEVSKVPIAVQAQQIRASTDDAQIRSMRMREFEAKVKQGTRRRSSWRRS